jgi:hypothetical protein
MIKINYLVTVNGDKASAQTDTLEAIKKVLIAKDKITQVCFGTLSEEEALNAHITSINPGDFTHIVIINNKSLLRDFAAKVNETYVTDLEAVYIPLVELCNDEKDGKVTFKGFLNSSIWKPYMAEETGILDQALTSKGADLILYGALIPVTVAQKHKFKPEIKHYSFFEYLNRLVNQEVNVIGIPKVTLRCVKDYELKDVPKEEKIAAWKIAMSAHLTSTLQVV